MSSSSSSSSEEEDNENLSRRERIQRALEKKRKLEQEAQQSKTNNQQQIPQTQKQEVLQEKLPQIQEFGEKTKNNVENLPQNQQISTIPRTISNNPDNNIQNSEENKENVENVENQSEESEYESDSEEETVAITFVSKKNRKTIEEKNRMEKERQEDEIRREREKVEKRLEEKKKFLEEQKKKAEKQQNPIIPTNTTIEDGVPEDLPDDDDESADFEKEFYLWKFREMKRLIRDTEKDADAQIAELEKERRSKMTDEEVVEELKREGKWDKDKKEWKFLQKYYHKGSFFNDDESGVLKNDIRDAIASSATLGDKVNKELLPEIMKVKDFGKRGRTKYTHLVDEDTTFKEESKLRKGNNK